MTPAGIEPATFRFVAQHLNRCATAVPIYILPILHYKSIIIQTQKYMETFCTWHCFSDRNSNLLGIRLFGSEGRTTEMFQLSYSHQLYQKPLWFVPVMLQLFVGRCGRRMPLKSPTDSIGGIKVGEIRAALSATLKPLWKVVRYEPLPKYSKSISSGLLAVWECTPCRRRNIWLVLRSLGWHLREKTAEGKGRYWLFAAECLY